MNHQMVATTSSLAKPAVQRGKITWPDEQSVQQAFSLPSSVIYYISKNPSNPTVYLRLVQSCKYFFEKLPLLVAKDFFEENKLCPNDEYDCIDNSSKCCVAVDLSKLSNQIWLTNEININEYDRITTPNFVSLLIPKLYRADIFQLKIYNQEVTFEDFIFMAPSAVEVILDNVTVLFGNGNVVTLDAVLEVIPKVENFQCWCSAKILCSSTLKNIVKLQNLSNLVEFDLRDIPEIGNVDDFLTVIKKLKDVKIWLIFDDNISEGFKNQLNALVDTVLKDETPKCVIKYDGQDIEKLKIMQKRM